MASKHSPCLTLFGKSNKTQSQRRNMDHPEPGKGVRASAPLALPLLEDMHLVESVREEA